MEMIDQAEKVMEMNEETQSEIAETPLPEGSRKRGLAALLVISLLANLALMAWLLWPRAESGKEPAAEAGAIREAASGEVKASGQRVELSPEAIKRAGIETIEAAMTALDRALEVPGRLAINEDATSRVGSFVEGRVTKITVRVGDRVNKGDALVYVHSHEVAQARADYARARASITRAEKKLAQAKIEAERAQRLFAAKAISQREEQQAATAVTAAEAELLEVRAEEQRAEEFLHHLGALSGGVDEAVIRAPQSGTVTERMVSVGTAVTPATDLLRITDLSTLWAIAEAPESQAGMIRTGQTIEMRVAAFPETIFSGRVVYLNEALNPETRTVEVRSLIRNPRGELRPEMFARIRIVTGEKERALLAPREAVHEMGGERMVFLDLGGGAFGKRAVRTGREQGEMIEITSGLEPGERFVGRGAFYIKSAFLKGTLSED